MPKTEKDKKKKPKAGSTYGASNVWRSHAWFYDHWPIMDLPWDEKAAQDRLFAHAEMDTDFPTFWWLEEWHLVYDDGHKADKSSWLLPLGDIVAGQYVVVVDAVREAAKKIHELSLPQNVVDEALNILGSYLSALDMVPKDHSKANQMILGLEGKV